MTLTRAWLRLELRRRWRSLVVLALLVALATGTVLTAVAGARRGASAPDRLLARVLPSDIAVLPNQPGFDWEPVRALPVVEALHTFALSGAYVEGEGGELIPVELPPVDDEVTRTIERPVILEGRLADPARADEAIVTERTLADLGVAVGDTVTLLLASPEQIDTQDIEEPAGPEVQVRIVGVGRAYFRSDWLDSAGGMMLTPAIVDRYRSNFMGTTEQVFVQALVRLRGGEVALPEFRAEFARVTSRSDVEIWNLHERFERHAKQVISYQSLSLLAFGLAALAAAVILVGQSVVRYVASTVVDLQVLRGIGLTPRQGTLVASAAPLLAAAAGGALGVGGAALASRWMPIGVATYIEPSPGIDFDWAVLGGGGVLAPVVVGLSAAGAAWATLAAARSRISPRRSVAAQWAARVGLPVPALVGTRFALEPGRGKGAVPVRPALVGATTGILGIVAAFTFSAGVSDAAGNPERFGLTYQASAFFGENGEGVPAKPVLAALVQEGAIAGANDALVAVAESGSESITTYTYDPVGAAPAVVLTSGRLPDGPGDVVLAPTTARNLRLSSGDPVVLTGRAGREASFAVSGVGFVPQGFHNNYDEGAWVAPSGYERLFPADSGSGVFFKSHEAQLTLAPGAGLDSLQTVAAELPMGEQVAFYPLEPPSQVAEIQDIRVLPSLLGGFLALLAVGAVGHALATAVRRRRHDVAVLRALGMTGRQSRWVVVTQATVLAGVGLVIGVPLGLALGRTVWRVVAENAPLHYQPPLAVWALLLTVPLALLIANLLAAWPGRLAAKLRVGQTLRAE